MATTLSILISDTSGCLICQRLALAVVSGQLLQKPCMKLSGVCVVSCTAFRGSYRFTAIVLIRQRQVEGLLPRVKTRLESLENEEQQRQMQEIEAEQQLRAEEIRLSDLRDQLDRLDKALENTSRRPGGSPK
jgi:hypothetical protein